MRHCQRNIVLFCRYSEPLWAYGSNAMASDMKLNQAPIVGSSLWDVCFDVKPGDMLFFSAGGKDGIGHSTISLGGSLLIYHGGRGGVPTIENISQNANHHDFYTVRRFKK